MVQTVFNSRNNSRNVQSKSRLY